MRKERHLVAVGMLAVYGGTKNIGHLKGKTNGKALEVSIQMNWTLKGSKLLKGMN